MLYFVGSKRCYIYEFSLLPVVCLHGGVVVLLGQLHAVDEVGHILA